MTRQQESKSEDVERMYQELKDSLSQFERFPILLEQLILKQAKASANQLRMILAIGYGGFFAIWALAQEHMSPLHTLLTASLMLLSLVAYVSNELMNWIPYSRLTRSKPDIIGARDLPEATEALRNFLEAQRASLDGLDVLRPRLYWAALILGVCGVGITLIAFGTSLWEMHTVSTD